MTRLEDRSGLDDFDKHFDQIVGLTKVGLIAGFVISFLIIAVLVALLIALL